jgi:hypothetical protein
MRLALLLAVALLVPSLARADEEVLFIPKNQEEAAIAASFGFYPTRRFESRLSYLDIRDGGSAVSLMLRPSVPMPYVLIPGIRIWRAFSIVRFDLPIISLNTPKVITGGIGDIHFVDGAVFPFKWGALGFGFGAILPSASTPVLGTGKLTVGPGVGAATWIVPAKLSVSVLVEAEFTIAGYPDRADFDVVFVQPDLVWNLPGATYLAYDPVISIDLNASGRATVPVNLAVGHAFSKRLVMEVAPEWIATGRGKNDVQVRLVVNYLGW